MLRHVYATIFSVALLAGPTTGSAAEREELNPWLDCGLGAMVFPDENLEIGAGISNVTWDLGTTAVTSATASPDTCKGTDNVRSAMFIQQTYDQLAMDLARGRGEYVDALASLHGCRGEAGDLFAGGLREVFAGIAADEGYAAMDRAARAERVYFAAQELLDTSLAGVCQAGA